MLNDTHRVPSGGIIMWSGAVANIPQGWFLCDGTNGTPNLTGKFVIHADTDSGGTHNPGDTPTVISAHTHTVSDHTHTIDAKSSGDPHVQTTSDGSTGQRSTSSAGSGNTGSTGSQTAYALAYIMKS